eukprot:CAMPEP_0177592424 /NCGR_PEP_ID=MMETSP0419_2-20121207/8554_1 /TAXON_ID=582737 /ORGANISM="Tetraselmis sp., Strain GSL018" /LENGTH=285 /DNA_ID=CAMNT_0019083293 /DNA_START=422 /DNA_END=1279 /DNA_ORIENTATION=-
MHLRKEYDKDCCSGISKDTLKIFFTSDNSSLVAVNLGQQHRTLWKVSGMSSGPDVGAVAATFSSSFETQGADTFGYISPPGKITPHRDVLRWVQSLDLAHSLKDCRRDLANGFLVAQIFSRYFPDKLQMHSFQNGHSNQTKSDNWWQIQKFCRKWRGQELPTDLVDDTIQAVPGAAAFLLQMLYEALTGKKVPQRPPTPPPEAEVSEEQPRRRPVVAPTVRGRARKQEEQAGSAGQPRNYALLGSKPVTRSAAPKAPVEFSKAGKIQLGEVGDVQELRRKLREAG